MATTGGTYASGTIFRIDLSTSPITFTVLYTFNPNFGDGSTPYGNLYQATDGNFYGTTYNGGTNLDGTLYKVTPSGAFTTLYDFTLGTDGGFPTGGMTEAQRRQALRHHRRAERFVGHGVPVGRGADRARATGVLRTPVHRQRRRHDLDQRQLFRRHDGRGVPDGQWQQGCRH